MWQEAYNEIDKLRPCGIDDISFLKVKSHVETAEEWFRYTMTPEMLMHNELVDEAERLASVDFGQAGAIKDDVSAKYQAQQIAKRLAGIEVSTWKEEVGFRKFDGKDFE